MKSAVLVCVVACASPSPIPPDTAHSGSRLKLAWYEFPDGMRTWAAPTDLYDAELSLRCTPTVWADGVTRCTPDFVGPQFTDAACTQAVVNPSSDPKPAIDTALACDTADATFLPHPTGPIYFGTGQTVTVPAIYVRSSDGMCNSVPPDPRYPNMMWTVGLVGRTLQPSDLVTTTIGYQGTGDVAVATLQSHDGLLVPLRPYDTRAGVSCETSQLAGVTDAPCVPLEGRSADVFVDPDCRQPGVGGEPRCGPPPVASLPTLGCPQQFEVTDTMQPIEMSCSNSQEPPGSAYLLGGPIDELWLSRAAEPSTFREQLVYVTAGDARVRDTARIYDAMLQTECSLSQVVDGGAVPCHVAGAASVVGDLSSDPGCTQPLGPLIVGSNVDGCMVRRPLAYADGYDTLYRIGAQHPGPVYDGPPGACSEYPYPVHELGEAVPASMLPVAVKRRDP